MIGGHLPDSWRRPSANDAAVLEPFRQELRRGCLALAVLAELRSETYGYGLQQSLMRHGLEVDRGTLYPLLRRLQSKGLLISEWREEGKRKKRFYRLSLDGARILEQLRGEWAKLDRSLEDIMGASRSKAA